MKFHLKHGKVTQNMHGASRNYRYFWDVSTSPSLIFCSSSSRQMITSIISVVTCHTTIYGLLSKAYDMQFNSSFNKQESILALNKQHKNKRCKSSRCL